MLFCVPSQLQDVQLQPRLAQRVILTEVKSDCLLHFCQTLDRDMIFNIQWNDDDAFRKASANWGLYDQNSCFGYGEQRNEMYYSR